MPLFTHVLHFHLSKHSPLTLTPLTSPPLPLHSQGIHFSLIFQYMDILILSFGLNDQSSMSVRNNLQAREKPSKSGFNKYYWKSRGRQLVAQQCHPWPRFLSCFALHRDFWASSFLLQDHTVTALFQPSYPQSGQEGEEGTSPLLTTVPFIRKRKLSQMLLADFISPWPGIGYVTTPNFQWGQESKYLTSASMAEGGQGESTGMAPESASQWCLPLWHCSPSQLFSLILYPHTDS